ncbi:MAG: rhodanese-like domain-containing protein [Rhodospirillales bacterium]|nr:rhodanese-like domain-containing protein [Rhodospirillales bacterium]
MSRVAIGVVAALILVAVEVRAGDSRVVDVKNDTLSTLIDRGVAVVDVRTRQEWRRTGVIAGSHLISAFDESGHFNPSFPAAVQNAVKPDQEVIIICATGSRSSIVSDLMTRRGGYVSVYNAVDGIAGWARSGSPLQTCQKC